MGKCGVLRVVEMMMLYSYTIQLHQVEKREAGGDPMVHPPKAIRGGSKGKGKRKATMCRTQCQHEGPCAGESDVILHSQYALRKLVMVNTGMSNKQREAMMGTIWRPLLQYPEIGMERHLTLALIKYWIPRWKAFRIGGRRVPFSVFDVALFMGLPAMGRRVELEGEELSTEVSVLVRGCVADWEQEEMASRVPGRSGKKRRSFRNYVAAMAKLCEENNEDEQVGLWLRLYVFMVLRGVLFPRTPYGAAWSMLHYVEDVDGMAGYAWAEAVWWVLVETMEDTQRKLADGPLLEVIPMLYPREHEMQHSVVRQFMATDAYGYYVDDGEGWLSVDERLRSASEAYT
ncbi:hypothetical protein Cgig2_000583 [Carnegiea gigantea]|uniref:Aminotransferase-like plant mobile domain-containing protein n=1 Tax=Carnegiea gigantea TaxID=171969 RepID=A0A9Q1GUK1_9CARY|nr:hypothetical protein Cgig2_000583 [Carnegiea gigantea]